MVRISGHDNPPLGVEQHAMVQDVEVLFDLAGILTVAFEAVALQNLPHLRRGLFGFESKLALRAVFADQIGQREDGKPA